MHTWKRVLFGATAATALAMVSANVAVADPPSGVTPRLTDIVGVGSDTTDQVIQALSMKYNNTNPANKLYNFNAVGTAKIRPKQGAPLINRPDGSSAGIDEIAKNQKVNGKFVIDFARSSRSRDADDPTNVKFVAFGQDALTWAANPTTNAPATLKTAQLKGIYNCNIRNWSAVGGKSGMIKPVLPQINSGTRATFLDVIGLTDAQVGGCVIQGAQENQGVSNVFDTNKANIVVPYSISKYIAQRYNNHQDKHGTLNLKKIFGVAATTGSGTNTVINANFPSAFKRLLYNVVRTADLGTARINRLFGKNGWICDSTPAKNTLKSYGIRSLGSACGTQS